MQFQNNDMDDLLRRAAEDYPLDTSGADWNKVLNALQDDENKEAAAVPVRKTSRRRFLWLLLLLPLGFVCNYYYGNGLLKRISQGPDDYVIFTETHKDQNAQSKNNSSEDQDIKTKGNAIVNPVPGNQLPEESNKIRTNNTGNTSGTAPIRATPISGSDNSSLTTNALLKPSLTMLVRGSD